MDINPLLLNVHFYYNYTDEYNEEQKERFLIIEDGKFSMKKIRNINFYNEIEENIQNTIKSAHSQDKNKEKLMKEEINKSNHDIQLALPYSSYYITQENLDVVVTKKKEIEKVSINIQNSLNSLISEYKHHRSKIMKTIYPNENIFTDITKNKIMNDIQIINEENKSKFFDNINGNLHDDFKYNDYKQFLENTFNYINLNSSVTITIMKHSESKYSEALSDLINYQSQENEYKAFDNKNYKRFFTKDNDNLLKKYFNTLKNNFDKNIEFESRYNNRNFNLRDISPPENLNKKKDLIDIIYNFSAYLLKPEVYEKYKSDKKALYDFVNKNKNLVKNIITYYNVYTILTKFYIIQDTIIEIDNEKLSEHSKLKYVKKIKCINQIEIKGNKNILFKNTINVYFEIECENINENNIIDFNINLINTENYTSKDVNKNIRDYINYNSKLFTQKTNIFKYIFLANNFNYKKFINDFYILKKKNTVFKQENPDNIIEALLNKNIVNKIVNNNKSSYYDKNNNLINEDLENLLTNIFIHKIFFKKDNTLYLNNKFYKIDKVEHAKKKIKEVKEQEKQKYRQTDNKSEGNNSPPPLTTQATNMHHTKSSKPAHDNDKKEMEFFLTKMSDDIRLSIFDINTKYYTYLDVYCYIKNSKDEKITFKNKFNSILSCNNSANNLDILFKKLLGEYYDNYFKKLLNFKGKKDDKIYDKIDDKTKDKIDDKIDDKLDDNFNKFSMMDMDSKNDFIKGGKHKKKKIFKLEKKYKKNKRKKSFKNGFKKNQKLNNNQKFNNKTIKLINLYLKI